MQWLSLNKKPRKRIAQRLSAKNLIHLVPTGSSRKSKKLNLWNSRMKGPLKILLMNLLNKKMIHIDSARITNKVWDSLLGIYCTPWQSITLRNLLKMKNKRWEISLNHLRFSTLASLVHSISKWTSRRVRIFFWLHEPYKMAEKEENKGFMMIFLRNFLNLLSLIERLCFL